MNPAFDRSSKTSYAYFHIYHGGKFKNKETLFGVAGCKFVDKDQSNCGRKCVS